MPKRVLILGCTGMLGHALFMQLSRRDDLDVYATARSSKNLSIWFEPHLVDRIRTVVDGDNFDTIIRAFASIQPEIVINCIGLIKQQRKARDPLSAITVNSMLPHRISMVCRTAGARMIHISTDCIFDGMAGMYKEGNPSNANDLYGRSKYLGEVDYPHCITLRTSIIGHELKGKLGLVEWFLAQNGKVYGYTDAIYSGFPTTEFANIIQKHVLTNVDLKGIYHLSSNPISKYDLLSMIAKKYDKHIEIEPCADMHLDRSLDSSLFQRITGYSPPSWDEMIDRMYINYKNSKHYEKPST